MLRRVRQTSNRLLNLLMPVVMIIGLGVGVAGSLTGCIDDPVVDDQDPFTLMGVRTEKLGYSKVYRQSYESIWRAAQIVMKYPVAVNNVDNGVLESEWVRAEDGFQSPIQKDVLSGTRYKLTLLMVKGKLEGKPMARVIIRKAIERQKDFFSDASPLVSDGLEEQTLLYRIERELVIDDAIKKAAAKNP